MMKGVFAVTLAMLAGTAESRWTGNVLVYNLMQNRTLEWISCNATGKGGAYMMSFFHHTSSHLVV
jgi:hypothetical protein